jgi:hypothetical protein
VVTAISKSSTALVCSVCKPEVRDRLLIKRQPSDGDGFQWQSEAGGAHFGMSVMNYCVRVQLRP